MTAFSSGLSFSIRTRAASTSSVGDACPDRTSSAWDVASRVERSSPMGSLRVIYPGRPPGQGIVDPMSELTERLRDRARAALPPVEGRVQVSGLHEPVEVLWDRWGVPHVYARNTHDLYFAQGFVLASERLFQMDFTLRLGSGHLSELLGEATLPLDRFIRTVGWNRAPERLMA